MSFFDLVNEHWDDLMKLVRKVLNALRDLANKD